MAKLNAHIDNISRMIYGLSLGLVRLVAVKWKGGKEEEVVPL